MKCWFSTIVCLLLAGAAMAAENVSKKHVVSGVSEREAIHLTIYNNNRALVDEIRSVQLPGGIVDLDYQGVASAILPETVAIRRVDGAAFQVLEQNYQYDLLSPAKLLEKFVGREVVLVRRVKKEKETAEERVRGTLLSTNDGTVWRIGDAIAVNPTYAYLEFPSVPDNLYARPTLVWLLETDQGQSKIESSYLTQGITCQADYVCTLSGDDRVADITGWVTIRNEWGATYHGARLKLSAG